MSAQPVVAAIGEMLWDVYLEASYFGGATANFACHAAALGAESWLITGRGNDAAGEEALGELARRGVRHDLVQVHPERPTGQVLVTFDAGNQPRYEIAPGGAWDDLVWNDGLAALAARCDAVCFGTLGQRSEASRAVIGRFLRATRPGALRVFDVNLRQHHHSEAVVRDSLACPSAVKLNDEELPVVARYAGCPGAGEEALIRIAREHGIRTLALTRGASGSTLLAEGFRHECVPPPTEVVDTVGAGDAFTAALTLGLLRGWPLPDVHAHATRVAAFVCSRRGATPALPGEIVRPLRGGGGAA